MKMLKLTQSVNRILVSELFYWLNWIQFEIEKFAEKFWDKVAKQKQYTAEGSWASVVE